MTAAAAEVAVIGGGPAGAAAAIRLVGAGRRVTLLEREAGPHDKVCGEFLSGEAQDYLVRLGVDPLALGAVPIERVRLVAGAAVSEAALPFRGLSLSRRRLDEALLVRAAAAGAELRRGARALALEGGPGEWRIRLDRAAQLPAAAVFLATGKHDLRGRARPRGWQGDLLAFKQHFRLAAAERAALGAAVELMPFAGGYAGLEPVEEGIANLCLVVRRRRFEALGRRWATLLAALQEELPLLARRLAGAEPLTARPLALAAIPYGHLRWRAGGIWRLGDQAAVIPSFAGDGMSIALHSGWLAAGDHLAGRSAGRYQARLAADLAAPVWFATALSQALVRRWPQRGLALAACCAPRLLGRVAEATRVPPAALARAGMGSPG